ncbi:MAG TPA: hypothetical protein VGC32_17225 [Solirubrobacterales bacterium]
MATEPLKLRSSQLETLRVVAAEGGSLDRGHLAEELQITEHSAERRLRRLTTGPGFTPLEVTEPPGFRGWPEIPVYTLTDKGKEALRDGD